MLAVILPGQCLTFTFFQCFPPFFYSKPEHSTENILRDADDFDPCHRYVSLASPADGYSPLAGGAPNLCVASSFNESATTTCDK